MNADPRLSPEFVGDLLDGHIWLDLTETTSTVHRTGVQRVLAQAIATAPDRGRLIPFSIAANDSILLHSQRILDLLGDRLFSEADFAKVRDEISDIATRPLARLDRRVLLTARAV